MNNISRITGFVLIALISAIAFNGIALAEDQLLNSEVQSVTTKLDKNGNEYTRVILTVERELNGVKYKTGAPVMAFGTKDSALVKNLKKGDKLKAIASYREYKGRGSYTLIKKLN